ncbi:hypothetical protein K474DRAFT_1665255 [Panus rudis PR-1116 ss-1]|nr:hypothetical protein K474DRAFT_1665255 [Panus rudis PR-1116 ss-1]
MKVAVLAMCERVEQLLAPSPIASSLPNAGNPSSESIPVTEPMSKGKQKKFRDTRLQAAVRAHTDDLMELDLRDGLIVCAKPSEVTDYSKNRHSGPSLRHFVPDFSDGVRNKWNKRLAFIFVNSFLASDWSGTKDKEKIKETFLTYLDTVKRHYNSQDNTERTQKELDTLESQRRANNRRNHLLRRVKACLAHPDLLKYHKLMEELSFHVVSGDETDIVDGQERVVATRLPWRSAEYEDFLVILDKVYMSTRFNGKAIKRGRLPDWRIRGSTRIEREFCEPVVGLPSNFYDGKWLSQLNDIEKEALNLKEPVPLTVTVAVMKLAKRWWNVRCKEDVRRMIDAEEEIGPSVEVHEIAGEAVEEIGEVRFGVMKNKGKGKARHQRNQGATSHP